MAGAGLYGFVQQVNRHGPTTAGGGFAAGVGGPVIFTLDLSMFGLWSKKRTFHDPELGEFFSVRTMWYPARSETAAHRLGATIEGDRERPDPNCVEVARKLLRAPDDPIQKAEAFVRATPRALEFMEGNGDLVCDGFTVYLSGDFAVEFSLTEWPDAMISVSFEAGLPCAVELGD